MKTLAIIYAGQTMQYIFGESFKPKKSVVLQMRSFSGTQFMYHMWAHQFNLCFLLGGNALVMLCIWEKRSPRCPGIADITLYSRRKASYNFNEKSKNSFAHRPYHILKKWFHSVSGSKELSIVCFSFLCLVGLSPQPPLHTHMIVVWE